MYFTSFECKDLNKMHISAEHVALISFACHETGHFISREAYLSRYYCTFLHLFLTFHAPVFLFASIIDEYRLPELIEVQ